MCVPLAESAWNSFFFRVYPGRARVTLKLNVRVIVNSVSDNCYKLLLIARLSCVCVYARAHARACVCMCAVHLDIRKYQQRSAAIDIDICRGRCRCDDANARGEISRNFVERNVGRSRNPPFYQLSASALCNMFLFFFCNSGVC